MDSELDARDYPEAAGIRDPPGRPAALRRSSGVGTGGSRPDHFFSDNRRSFAAAATMINIGDAYGRSEEFMVPRFTGRVSSPAGSVVRLERISGAITEIPSRLPTWSGSF